MMNEREAIEHIKQALAGRNPEQVSMKDLEQYLDKTDPVIKTIMQVYRDSMADGPLLALDVIARRKERKAKRASNESVIAPDIDDTIIIDPQKPPEEGEEEQ